MEEKKKRKKVEIRIVFTKTEGDPLERVIDALAPNIRLALMKHGATLKMDVKEVLRNHARE